MLILVGSYGVSLSQSANCSANNSTLVFCETLFDLQFPLRLDTEAKLTFLDMLTLWFSSIEPCLLLWLQATFQVSVLKGSKYEAWPHTPLKPHTLRTTRREPWEAPNPYGFSHVKQLLKTKSPEFLFHTHSKVHLISIKGLWERATCREGHQHQGF